MAMDIAWIGVTGVELEEVSPEWLVTLKCTLVTREEM